MSAPPQQDHVDLELRDYLRVIRRRWALILLIAGIAFALALANSLRQSPTYEARARVLLDVAMSEQILARENSRAPSIDDQVTTELDNMRSARVHQAIRDEVGYTPRVRVLIEESEGGDTRAISVIGIGDSPEVAARHANDFAQTFVVVRKEDNDADLSEAIANQRALLDGLDVEADRKQKRIEQIDLELLVAEGDSIGRLEAERRRLQDELAGGTIATSASQINSRIGALTQAQITNAGRGMFDTSEAAEPGAPASPRPTRDALVGLLVGLALGVVAAYLRDYYDDTLRTKEDLDLATGHIPVLGIIPQVRGWRDEKVAVLESIAHPSSAASEAYRGLRTSLEFSGVDRDIATIHITSSTPGEGKSTSAANLAVTLARAGKHVVLVDCDLRRPRAHQFFGLDNTVGLTTVILGTTPLDQALQRVPDLPGLFVLTSGPKPPNPAELLSSDITRSKLEVLARSADYVILDSPPLLPVADSVILAGYADASLLVVKARHANRRSVNRSIEILEQVEAPLLGLILNSVGHEATYGYGYGYGYTNEDPDFRELLMAKARVKGSEGEHLLTPSRTGTGSDTVDSPNGSTTSNGQGDASADVPKHARHE